MSNVLDSIAPSPDNLILYAMMAVCDLTVFIFFIIRYFIIYAVAVLCTIIAVMLVPDWSRDFAKKTIDNILRILLLQPVAIFFTVLLQEIWLFYKTSEKHHKSDIYIP